MPAMQFSIPPWAYDNEVSSRRVVLIRKCETFLIPHLGNSLVTAASLAEGKRDEVIDNNQTRIIEITIIYIHSPFIHRYQQGLKGSLHP